MNGVGQGYAVAQTPGGRAGRRLVAGPRPLPDPGAGGRRRQLRARQAGDRGHRPGRQRDRVAADRRRRQLGRARPLPRRRGRQRRARRRGHGLARRSRADRRPGRVRRRRPLRRRRGGDGPGHAGREDAGGRDLRPPAGRAVHRRDRGLQAQDPPRVALAAGNDPWGVQTFRVYMDGVQIGQTTGSTLVPATPLATGKHTWQVESVDRAGQIARSRVRTLKIDAHAADADGQGLGQAGGRQAAEDRGHARATRAARAWTT